MSCNLRAIHSACWVCSPVHYRDRLRHGFFTRTKRYHPPQHPCRVISPVSATSPIAPHFVARPDRAALDKWDVPPYSSAYALSTSSSNDGDRIDVQPTFGCRHCWTAHGAVRRGQRPRCHRNCTFEAVRQERTRIIQPRYGECFGVRSTGCSAVRRYQLGSAPRDASGTAIRFGVGSGFSHSPYRRTS